MCCQRGFLAVLVLIVIMFLSLAQERSVSRVSPVLLAASIQKTPDYIALCGAYFSLSGQCVIVRGSSVAAIVARANTVTSQEAVKSYLAAHVVAAGQSLTVRQNSSGKLIVDCAYMPAAQRMALGIALNPDHMTEQDWQALPGVGGGIARAIVADRLANGDFRSFAALGRVHGIGAKTLERLNGYFE